MYPWLVLNMSTAMIRVFTLSSLSDKRVLNSAKDLVHFGHGEPLVRVVV